MNKYYEYMEEITKDEIFEGLLGHGLFSDKLPPIFSSVNFYNYCKKNILKFNYKNFKNYNYCFYESMRNINVPRPIAIPNPLSYYSLCGNIMENWDKIVDHFKNKTFSNNYKVSRIHLRKQYFLKSLFYMNYEDNELDFIMDTKVLIGSNFFVKADISNCFPSIYSHSIPWALVGKNNAKINMKTSAWYNSIDKSSRNIKNGETNGLLIGPHTSNLLSEIVLTDIDSKLIDLGFMFIRHIDDYTCYCESIEKANLFIITLKNILRNYNLVLNHKKTLIKPLPFSNTSSWVTELNSINLLNSNNCIDVNEIKSYLNCVINLMNKNNNDAAIYKYSLKTIIKKKLSKKAMDYLFSYTSHLSLIYPYVVHLLEHLLTDYNNNNNNNIIDFDLRKYSFQKIFNYGKNNLNSEAISYSLYYSIKHNEEIIEILNEFDFDTPITLNIKSSNKKEVNSFILDEFTLDEIKHLNCPVCLLISFLYSKKFFSEENTKEYVSYAKLLIDSNQFEENWIFIYECLDYKTFDKNMKSNNNYNGLRVLKKNKISFISDSFKDIVSKKI
ncbi:MAG: RNA-directed DNA polymerase [Anaeroplasmataceae bacterium]